MKLQNKKTGEIGFVYTGLNGEVKVCSEHDENHTCLGQYSSLSELNEEWQDYGEPKNFWYIEPNGVIARIDEWDCCTDSDIGIMKILGNHFETKEEAEKAVEKLKAFRRLRNLGFEFKDWRTNASCKDAGVVETTFNLWADLNPEIVADLDLLFGGEE